ncbi:MAG: energy-coupling factor transporter transmembrane component T family protein [Candidatus Hodarchaeales archaeon]
MSTKNTDQQKDLISLDPFIHETNPLIKFIIIFIIAIYYFIEVDLIKVYIVLTFVLLYFNLSTFPYQVSRPKYKFLLLFSVVIFSVQVLSLHQGDFLFYLIPSLSSFGPFIPVYSDGLYYGILLLGRFWGVITISWVFVDSTNPFDFAHSLTKIGIPYRIAYSLSLSLRFTPVLNTEIRIIRRAQQTRGLNTNPNSFRGAFNVLKYTLFPLISSTLNRIRDITLSMEGRAFGLYEQRTSLKEIPLRLTDGLKLFTIILILSLLIIVK